MSIFHLPQWSCLKHNFCEKLYSDRKILMEQNQEPRVGLLSPPWESRWFLDAQGPEGQVLVDGHPGLPSYLGLFPEKKLPTWFLPVFAHPSFSSVYCIARAVVWYTNVTLLSSTCRIWWFSFWDTMLQYFSFDECSLWFASLSKLSSDPYRNQDKVYNLAARKLGFNKFPSQSNVSTNEWLVGLGSPASFGTGCSWPE